MFCKLKIFSLVCSNINMVFLNILVDDVKLIVF